MVEVRRIDSRAHSLQEVFGTFRFKVPVYQRDFAWTKEEVDTLWNDIITAVKGGSPEYFLGAITACQSQDAKTFEVIDGQQRLAVLSMIFRAVANSWKSLKDDLRFNDVFRDYLGSRDRRTREVQPKLSLNENNNHIYQALILEGKEYTADEKKLWVHSNKLLCEAHHGICENLGKWLEGFDDQSSALLDLEDFLSNKVIVILIQASDESDAFVLFETLNDRGLDLAVSDLVKNYLFSMANTHLDRFKKAWTEVSTLVGSENLTVFLRHCWLSEHELVRERELYKALRAKIKGSTGTRQFMEGLRKKADLYAALANPEHAYWADFPPEMRDHLDALLLFKVGS